MIVRLISLVAILTISASFTTPNDVEVKWNSISDAQISAKEEGKAIFIDFTADWCGWCKVMDKNTFSDPAVASYMNEHFFAVRLDYDSKEQFEFFGEMYTARQLGEKYKVPGLPTIVLVSSDNTKSKKLVGYKKAEPFLDKLKSSKL